MASDATTLFQGLFLGEYDHTLDAQCRVSLPSDWRNRGEETTMVLIPARGKALLLLPVPTFLEFVEKAKKVAIANSKLQMALAFLGSRSRQCRCDKQGRLALDRKMLDSIGVQSQLKLIGAINHIRLTAPENWQLPGEDELEMYFDEIQKVSEGGDDNLSGLLAGVLGRG